MRNNDMFDLLWVGKFDFRKQLQIALRVMATLKDFPSIRLHVLGSGNEAETAYYKSLIDELEIAETTTLHSQVSHAQVLEMMAKANLFLFTSIADETSTVVLEAIGAGLPVVCFNAGGYGAVVGNEVGRTIPFTNPDQSVADFRRAILEIYAQPELQKSLSTACIQKSKTLTWGYKARQMVDIYKKISLK